MADEPLIVDSKGKIATALQLEADIGELVERSLQTIERSRKVLRAADRLNKALRSGI